MADDYEIVENGTDDMDVVRDPRASVRDAMASIDAQRNALKAQKEFGFDESSFGYNVYENKEIETYGLAEQRKDNLKNVMENDILYSSYFSKRYGSLSVYLEMDDQLYPKGFNPLSDKYVSVKIAKEGKLYIADFINPNQIIEELLDGIVSFLVMKVNGQVAIIMGSLKEGIVNGEENVRQAAFSPLGDGRILLWSTVKQKWSSFYPDNLLSMTRDDTNDLE